MTVRISLDFLRETDPRLFRLHRGYITVPVWLRYDMRQEGDELLATISQSDAWIELEVMGVDGGSLICEPYGTTMPVPAPESPQEPRNHTDVTQGPSEEIERLRAALEHIAYGIDTTEPSGAFADDAASNPPIGLTDEEAWQIMRSVARRALQKPDSQPGGGE